MLIVVGIVAAVLMETRLALPAAALAAPFALIVSGAAVVWAARPALAAARAVARRVGVRRDCTRC